MRKFSILLILTLIFVLTAIQEPCHAGIIQKYKYKIEQKKIYSQTISEIKSIIIKQDDLANKKDLDNLSKLYSDNFLNSDGFNKTSYIKLIKETWETYPDINYSTEIKNIEFTDNYATIFVNEKAVATSKEKIGEYETVGELLSNVKCVYHFEKQGKNWLISSERIIEENTSLKYGEARYIDIKIDAPKQIGTNTYYTATLKTDAPDNAVLVGSITREKIVHPQQKSEDAFRKIHDNTLERVFLSNSDDVNEYVVASVGITHAENYDESRIRIYMSGMAFVMTRINVIPENKFIKFEDKEQ